MFEDVLEIEQSASDMADFGTGLDPNIPLQTDDGSGEDLQKEASEEVYANRLLTALATMAVRSRRRQADLSSVLWRSGLDADPVRVSEALDYLQSIGCIENLVPLYDGGMLMSLTGLGIDHLNSALPWKLSRPNGFPCG